MSDQDRCRTCGADIDTVIAATNGHADVHYHWAHATSARGIGFTCSKECADTFESTRPRLAPLR